MRILVCGRRVVSYTLRLQLTAPENYRATRNVGLRLLRLFLVALATHRRCQQRNYAIASMVVVAYNKGGCVPRPAYHRPRAESAQESFMVSHQPMHRPSASPAKSSSGAPLRMLRKCGKASRWTRVMFCATQHRLSPLSSLSLAEHRTRARQSVYLGHLLAWFRRSRHD